jgi:hypothetical protein
MLGIYVDSEAAQIPTYPSLKNGQLMCTSLIYEIWQTISPKVAILALSDIIIVKEKTYTIS